MKIALIDDDAKFLAQTVRRVKRFLKNHSVAAEVMTFSAAEELPAADFDLYLLEVGLPGMSGIKLGRRIRQTQPEAPILFCTTSRNYAVEAFRRRKSVRSSDLTFKNADGITRVALSDLVLVETAGHHMIVQVTDGRTLIVRQPMQELWEKLKGDDRFVRVGRHSIVGLAHVIRFAGSRLTLVGGKTVSVSRRSLAEFKTAFVSFYGT